MQYKIYLSRLRAKIFSMLARVVGVRIRILSMVIFCGVLVLSVKINCFIKTMQTQDLVQLFVSAYAEETAKIDTSLKDQKPANSSTDSPGQGTKATSSTGLKPDKSIPSVTELKKDPLTSEQFKALEQLNAPSPTNGPPTNTVPVQQAIDSAIKNKIEQQVNELDKARTNLESLVKGVEEKEKANLGRLIKMAESMKPEEASKIMETLELPVLMDLIEGIKPAKGAAILAVMDAPKAGYLMNELAKRQKVIKSK